MGYHEIFFGDFHRCHVLNWMESETIIHKILQHTGFLTVTQASEYLAIHPVTLRGWIQEGKFPAARIGNKWRIDPAEIADWIQERSVGV